MKSKLALKILGRILDETDVYDVQIKEALEPVYVEYSEELETIEKEYPKEFDLVILNNLSHWEINLLDQDFLGDYENIEMRIRDGHLEIFQTEKEVAEDSK